MPTGKKMKEISKPREERYFNLRRHYYSLMKTAGTPIPDAGEYLLKAKRLVPILNELERELTMAGVNLIAEIELK